MSALLPILVVLLLPSERIDFVYYEGEGRDRDSIEVNFGLHGQCADAGAWLAVAEGVLLISVRADGRSVEPTTSRGYRHDYARMVVDHPGPSFFYHMPLSRLESAAPYDASDPLRYEGTLFDVPGLPRRLEITYAIRCADGSVSKPRITRGRRLPLPKPIEAHPAKRKSE